MRFWVVGRSRYRAPVRGSQFYAARTGVVFARSEYDEGFRPIASRTGLVPSEQEKVNGGDASAKGVQRRRVARGPNIRFVFILPCSGLYFLLLLRKSHHTVIAGCCHYLSMASLLEWCCSSSLRPQRRDHTNNIIPPSRLYYIATICRSRILLQ